MEEYASDGYTLDKEKQIYNISYKDSSTGVIEVKAIEKNRVEKGKLEVIKVSTNENKIAQTVEGAEFTVILSKYVNFYGSFEEALKHIDEYAEDEYSIFKTGEDGHGVSNLLAYGRYTVNETYTPSAQINTVEEFHVTIDRDSSGVVKEVVANDTPFEAYVRIQKKDKNSGKTITYSKATFALYKLNENTNEYEKVKCKVGNKYYDQWTTDETGVAFTETKLKAGKYKLEELVVPNNYTTLDGELIFELNNDVDNIEYDEDYDAYVTVVAEDEQVKGKLNLSKTIKLKDDVDKSLIKDIDFNKISFELVAKEDIIDFADGSVIYPKGTRIGEYNLDESGHLIIDNLNIGCYYLKELSTIDGVALDETEYDVIFTQTDTTTKEYNLNLSIENKTTITEFSKIDLTGEKELVGAELSVIDENNNIVDSWTSTDKTHTIEGLQIGKKYILHEDLAPLGYTKSTDVEFIVENTGEMQKVTMIDKIVQVTKTDLVTGEELEGAELTITDENGNFVDEWTSTKEPHNVIGLEENKKYFLTEKWCPYRIRNS